MNCECRECRELSGDDSTSGKRTRSGMTSWNNVQVTQDIPQTSLSTVFIGNLETVRSEICVLSRVIWILFLERLAVVKFTVSSTNIITFTSTYWDGRSIFKPQKSWTNECQWADIPPGGSGKTPVDRSDKPQPSFCLNGNVGALNTALGYVSTLLM